MKKNNKSPFDIEPRFIKLDNRKNRPLVPITKEFLEKLHILLLPQWMLKNKNVLDLGSCIGATGQWCLYYGAKSYTGVEVQKENTNISKELLKPYKNKIKIINNSIEEFLKKNEKKFDIVILSGILYVFIDYYSILKKISKTCNGHIVILNMYPNINKNKHSIIELNQSGINLADTDKTLSSVGSKISPKALNIIMNSLGFFSKEGVLSNESSLRGFSHKKFDRYLIRFEKKNKIKKSLSKLLINRSLKQSIIQKKIDNNKIINKIKLLIQKNSDIKENYLSKWDDWKKIKIKKNNYNEWKFDKTVAKNFNRIAKTNIPDYLKVIKKSIEIIKIIFQNKKSMKIIDIGCATGNTLKELEKKGYKNLYGIEKSEDMIEKAYKSKFINYIHNKKLPKNLGKFNVIIANWTLHFINNREKYLQDIYDSLENNGIFILTEKVSASECIKKSYKNFKKTKGLNDKEILQKENSIKGILVPYPIEWYFTTLYKIGFSSIEVINAHYSFISFLIKK